jgi:hypothetical protein
MPAQPVAEEQHPLDLGVSNREYVHLYLPIVIGEQSMFGRVEEANRAPQTTVCKPAQLTVAPNARPSRYVAAAAP